MSGYWVVEEYDEDGIDTGEFHSFETEEEARKYAAPYEAARAAGSMTLEHRVRFRP